MSSAYNFLYFSVKSQRQKLWCRFLFYLAHDSMSSDKWLVILHKTKDTFCSDKRSTAISQSTHLFPHSHRKLIQIYYVLIHFSFNAKRLLSFERHGMERASGETRKTDFFAAKRYCYRWVAIYLAYFPIRSQQCMEEIFYAYRLNEINSIFYTYTLPVLLAGWQENIEREEWAKLNERNCLEFIITFSMHVYF